MSTTKKEYVDKIDEMGKLRSVYDFVLEQPSKNPTKALMRRALMRMEKDELRAIVQDFKAGKSLFNRGGKFRKVARGAVGTAYRKSPKRDYLTDKTKEDLVKVAKAMNTRKDVNTMTKEEVVEYLRRNFTLKELKAGKRSPRKSAKKSGKKGKSSKKKSGSKASKKKSGSKGKSPRKGAGEKQKMLKSLKKSDAKKLAKKLNVRNADDLTLPVLKKRLAQRSLKELKDAKK